MQVLMYEFEYCLGSEECVIDVLLSLTVGVLQPAL